MRMMKVDMSRSLEEYHRQFGGKLHRGRPEMLLLRMSNGRNIQLFRKGTIQILGPLSQSEAENMINELLLRLQLVPLTELTISNMVISAQLKTKKEMCLKKIACSDAELFYEIEIFPAALISKWAPAHVAMFHNGKVIITGVKSMDDCNRVLSLLESI